MRIQRSEHGDQWFVMCIGHKKSSEDFICAVGYSKEQAMRMMEKRKQKNRLSEKETV